jgi:phosphate starvation-inducible PhoH-like protein
MDEDEDGAQLLHTRRADLKARTPTRACTWTTSPSHDITFGIGPAGTGKTYLAVACAVDALERSAVQRIVLTRPAVEAGERLGFLPGDLTQKVDPYLRPLYDALYDLMGFERVHQGLRAQCAGDRAAGLHARPHAEQRLRDPGRGAEHHARADEDVPHPHRLRQQVRGDRRHQPDRPAQGQLSGLVDAERVLKRVKGIAHTHFTSADVVRHPLVARIVDAYDARKRKAR